MNDIQTEIDQLRADLAEARAQRDNGNRAIERLTDELEQWRAIVAKLPQASGGCV